MNRYAAESKLKIIIQQYFNVFILQELLNFINSKVY